MGRFKIWLWLCITGLTFLALTFGQETGYPEPDRCEPGEVVTIENESLRFLVYQELLRYLPRRDWNRPNMDEERYRQLTFADLDAKNAFLTKPSNQTSMAEEYYNYGIYPENWTSHQITCEVLNLVRDLYFVGLEAYVDIEQVARDRLVIDTLEGLQHMQSLYRIGGNAFYRTGYSSTEEMGYANYIEDLSPLTAHPSLQIIFFPEVRFDNYNVLTTIPNLKSLTLSGNGLENIDFLEGAPVLERLFLQENTIKFLNDFPHISTLQILNLRNNGLHTLAGDTFTNLRSLKYIFLSNNMLREVTDLIMPPSLESIDLANNDLKEIDIVKFSPSLISLLLADNRLKSLSFLNSEEQVSLPSLELLDISNNFIEDVTTLVNHPSIGESTSIYLQGNCLNLDFDEEDIVAIQQLTAQAHLVEVADQRDDCVPYANLVPQIPAESSSLRLRLDMPQDADFEDITELNIGDLYNINSLTYIAHFENLEYLSLPFSEVDSFYGLQKLSELQSIDLRGNLIRSFQPLLDNPHFGSELIVDVRGNCFDPSPSSKAMQDVQKLLERGVIVIGAELYGDHCTHPEVTEVTLNTVRENFIDGNFIPRGEAGNCQLGKYAYIPDPNLREALGIHPHKAILGGWVLCDEFTNIQPQILNIDGRNLGLNSLKGLQYFKSIESLDLTAFYPRRPGSGPPAYHYYRDISPLLHLPNLREVESWGLLATEGYHDAEALCGMKMVIKELNERSVIIAPDRNSPNRTLNEAIINYCPSD